MVTGGRMTRLVIPISAAVLSFFFTYETEAGSSPTRTRARHGLRPEIASTSALSSATSDAAMWLPSIRCMEGKREQEWEGAGGREQGAGVGGARSKARTVPRSSRHRHR